MLCRTLSALIAGGMLVTTSCAPALPRGDTPAASRAQPPAATAAPTSLTHLTVAYSNISATILPLWVAKEAGIFEKHGLDVDLQYAASATSVAAVLSGQMQMASVGLSEVLGAIAGGADLVIVANQVPAYTYVFEVAPGIQTPSDLKGKSIGISRPGSSSDIGTRVVLKKYGIDPDNDVTLVQTGSVTERGAAMNSGAIQGAVASPPETLSAERLGWHPIFDLAGLGLPAVTLGVIVQRGYRDGNRPIVQAYIDSLVEGAARVRSDRALAIDLLKTNMKIDSDDDLKVTYDYFTGQSLMPVYPYAQPAQFADTLEILGKSNENLTKLDMATLLDTSFVKSAEERGVANN
jgi:NitT/TauT family transport system substrate-binding protein